MSFFSSTSIASAETHAMTCKNPSREYRAVFNAGQRSFHVDAVGERTEYKVLAVENSGKQFVVAGLTVNSGPTFRAQFRPRKQIEFFTDGKLFQTDPCR